MGIVIRLVVSAASLWAATLLFSEDVIGSVFGRQARIALTDETFSLAWFGTLVLVAVIFGVVNAVLRPIIKTIGCAAYALTLGLFALVVNGALLILTAWIADGLGIGFELGPERDDFWDQFGLVFWPSAVLGALVIGLVSWLLNKFVKDRRKG